MEDAKVQLMSQLFGEVERAWCDHHDRTLVYHLAEEHPDLREALYEFFEDLILSESAEIAPDIAEAEERVSGWIQTAGFDLATASAKRERLDRATTTEPSSSVTSLTDHSEMAEHSNEPVRRDTWIHFLRHRLRQSLPNLVKVLPNVNVEYLVLVSRHPEIVPTSVRRALAVVVEKEWRVPAEESLQYLTSHQVVRAASRSRPFTGEPVTFQQLLDRSALSEEQKRFWLRYGESE